MSPQMQDPSNPLPINNKPRAATATADHPGARPQTRYHAGNLAITLGPALSPREAAADALHRFIMGMDTNDAELFDSAFFPSACWDLRGKQVHGIQEIHDQCFDFNMTKLDSTHYITSLRVSVSDCGTKAEMTALFCAHHYRLGTGQLPGAPRFSTGGTYYLQAARDEEASEENIWKISLFRGVPTWTEGTFEVMGHTQFPKIVRE